GSEANVRADTKAAQAVFSSGIPLLVIPRDATADLKLDDDGLRRVFSPGTALTLQVQALHQLWDGPSPVLADALAVALCLDERFAKMAKLHLEVDGEGVTRIGKGKPNAR